MKVIILAVFLICVYMARYHVARKNIKYVSDYVPEPAGVTVICDSNDDSINGSGAQSLMIEVLDERYKRADVLFYTSGTDKREPTPQRFIRIIQASVRSFGKSLSNVGNITISIDGHSTITIKPLQGKSQLGKYTTP